MPTRPRQEGEQAAGVGVMQSPVTIPASQPFTPPCADQKKAWGRKVLYKSSTSFSTVPVAVGRTDIGLLDTVLAPFAPWHRCRVRRFGSQYYSVRLQAEYRTVHFVVYNVYRDSQSMAPAISCTGDWELPKMACASPCRLGNRFDYLFI